MNSHSARLFIFVTLVFSLAACSSASLEQASPRDDDARSSFVEVMEDLASAWNGGDADKAAECFTEDAVYTQPPDQQYYEGRDALFEFFGGDEGRAGEMTMVWHHLAYDAEKGVGFGEFSFTYGSAAHGVAVVRLRDGKIANWREYWYGSDLPWEQFVASNPF